VLVIGLASTLTQPVGNAAAEAQQIARQLYYLRPDGNTGIPVGSGFSNEVHIPGERRSAGLTTAINWKPLAPGEYYMGVAIGEGDRRRHP
jgi:hypothetical protein